MLFVTPTEKALVPIAVGMAEAEDLFPDKVEVNYSVGSKGKASVKAEFVKMIASEMRLVILPVSPNAHWLWRWWNWKAPKKKNRFGKETDVLQVHQIGAVFLGWTQYSLRHTRLY
eukprot:GHVQ01020444.1.p1 GENE.GHVQ01020444.1~~GHVQ01020444.1.p1  ORF type:complete len:115 (-),score=11.93 GHVQ01020444.1:647-991(-)